MRDASPRALFSGHDRPVERARPERPGLVQVGGEDDARQPPGALAVQRLEGVPCVHATVVVDVDAVAASQYDGGAVVLEVPEQLLQRPTLKAGVVADLQRGEVDRDVRPVAVPEGLLLR